MLTDLTSRLPKPNRYAQSLLALAMAASLTACDKHKAPVPPVAPPIEAELPPNESTPTPAPEAPAATEPPAEENAEKEAPSIPPITTETHEAPADLDLLAESADNAHPHWERLEFGGSGDIEFRDGILSIESGEMLSGVRWTNEESLPTTNYEVTLKAQKGEGYDFFCGLTFPIGDLETCATLILGGWGGGVTGLSSVDNLDASENGTTEYKRFEDGKWYEVRLRVTDAAISAWLDGELLFEQETEGRQIALRPGQIDMCMPFGLATFQTDAAYKDFVMTRLGEAE